MKKSIINQAIIATLFLSLTSVYAKESPLTVSVSPLVKLLISANNSAPAVIISLNHSTISAEITGRALKLSAETGDFVNKGHKLVTLDCSSYSLAKKQAEAALHVAKTQLNYSQKQFRRNQSLLKRGIIPRETYEKAEAGRFTALADIELKKASIESTKLAISRCQIYAPFSGQITKRIVQQGQLVTPNTPLFQLMQSNKLEVKANLSFADVAKLKDSPSLEFISNNKKLKAKVRSIISIIDENTRTQEVRLSLPKKAKVSSGQSGRITWSSKDKLLPAEFIMRRTNQLGVMTVIDIVEGIGKAKFIFLPNAKEGQAASVRLFSNSAIITKNRYRVRDGETVKVKADSVN